MSKARAAIILAGGEGSRMCSRLSKVLHKVGGRSMLAWVAESARQAGCDRLICVIGSKREDVRAEAEALGLETAEQAAPLGTADAVLSTKAALADFKGDVVVLYGDTPFIQSSTLEALFSQLSGSDMVVVGFEPACAADYGRLRVHDGQVEEIIEAAEADVTERAIGLCNGGVMVAGAQSLFTVLTQVENHNAKNEYYLTDCVGILHRQGGRIGFHKVTEDEMLGVNSRADLARAEAVFQDRMRCKMLEQGVSLQAPDTVYFSFDTEISSDVQIAPYVVFGVAVKIGVGSIIHAFSHIEGADIGKNVSVGPFARVRSETALGADSRIGNFVELKQVRIGAGSKVNHLSYVGNAQLGTHVNVGAGVITCNYDGFDKYTTHIGDQAFIGSNSALIAPVQIGADAYIGSGSVVTRSVPEGALGLARAEQINRLDWVERFRRLRRGKKE